MKLRITPAGNKDIRAIATVLDEATAYKQIHGDTAWGSDAWADTEVLQMMKDSSVYVAYQGEALVGTVTIQWQDASIWGEQTANAGYLHRLAITQQFHGKGYGEQIINWVCTEVVRRGYQFVRLDCEAKNKQLCAYYEKQGFQRVTTKLLETYEAALYERSL